MIAVVSGATVPGIYTVTALGQIGGHAAADSKAVNIGASQVAEVQLTLFAPQAKATTV
jgi:hypothetical protein